MQDVLLFPYSATAVEALDCLGDNWKCIGFVSDDKNVIGTEVYNIKVFGRSAFLDFPQAKVLAVHGSPNSYLKRQIILRDLEISDARFATVIHKNASVSKMATIGSNVLIMAGVVITANAVLKNNVVVLPNSVIHHDTLIGDLTLIGANVTIAGNVNVGSNCYLGAASSLKNNISIGEKTIIGIGANVINSCLPNSKMVGNPARNLI